MSRPYVHKFYVDAISGIINILKMKLKNIEASLLATPLRSGFLFDYLRGKVWVSSGETGHNPDVTGSYQAQGPSFLQYIPVEK